MTTPSDFPTIILHADRTKAVLNHHPWIFSGAIKTVRGAPAPGGRVRLADDSGRFLAWGYWNAQSQIRVRLLSWDEGEAIDDDFWRRRLTRAIAARGEDNQIAAGGTPLAYRLVNAENDYLPGLVVDRYGDWLVLQALTLGIEARKTLLVGLLDELLHPVGIYERSDVDVREKEGLAPASGLLAGQEPPDLIEIDEFGRRFLVDVRLGPKARNGRHAADEDFVVGDVFQYLRLCRDSRRQFDIIVLDPPKFAQSARQVESAARGYKDINLLAFKLLKPGGLLLTFSCSGGVTADLFRKIVFGALVDAGREAQVLQTLGAGPDHPVALTFPEGEYLKGLLLKVW